MTADAMTTEALTALAAMQQPGTFKYERNQSYDSHKGSPIQGHVIRYKPHPKDLGDGRMSYGFNFPAVVATDLLGNPEENMRALAEQINAAPAIAAELLTSRSQIEALRSEAAAAWDKCEERRLEAVSAETERDAALARVRVLEEAMEIFASDESWKRDRACDVNSATFVGQAIARAALNQEVEG